MHGLSVLLPKMRAYCGAVSTVMGVFLLLLTGVRTGELRLATPDQFDLKKRLWVIPPEVVKQLQVHMRKTRRKHTAIPPHIVPLSHQAVEIVRLMLSLVRAGRRIPDWQLDPLRHELVLTVMRRGSDVDAWVVGRVCSSGYRHRPAMAVLS